MTELFAAEVFEADSRMSEIADDEAEAVVTAMGAVTVPVWLKVLN